MDWKFFKTGCVVVLLFFVLMFLIMTLLPVMISLSSYLSDVILAKFSLSRY